jgi:hypothetical protein
MPAAICRVLDRAVSSVILGLSSLEEQLPPNSGERVKPLKNN